MTNSFQEWLNSLEPEARHQAQDTLQRLNKIGVPDAELWIKLEAVNNRPYVAQAVLMHYLWTEADNWRVGDCIWIDACIQEAEKYPDASFADVGVSLKKMLEAGVERRDIGNIARMAAYNLGFGVLYWTRFPDEGENLPGWTFVEVDAGGELTGRTFDGAHESFLGSDPSGREGRPEQIREKQQL